MKSVKAPGNPHLFTIYLFLFEALDMLLPDTIYQSLQVKSSSFN
jgi:hypothetical protein